MKPGWGARGHHWKLIVTIVAFAGVAYWAMLMKGWLLASVVLMVGVAIFLLQWYSIDTPSVEEKDRHGAS
jgi:hypothetical protein